MEKKKDQTKIYQYFSSLSDERLEQLLRMEYLTEDSECLTEDEIQSIMKILDERAEKKEVQRIDPAESWKSFLEDYLPLADEEDARETISEEGKTVCRKEKGADIGKKKTDSVFFFRKRFRTIAVVCCCVLLFSVTATGRSLFSKIAHWTDELFILDKSDCGTNDGIDSSVDIQKIFNTDEILPKVMPTELPPNMTEVSRDYAEDEDSKYFVIRYEDPDTKDRLQFSAIYMNDISDVFYEKDPSLIEIHQHNETDYYIMNNLDLVNAVWQKGPLECQISGNVTRSEIKEIIDSIPE